MTPLSEIKNTNIVGLGIEMLASEPGAFVVMEECTYDSPYEIARYEHDGSPVKRANAYGNAVNKSISSQNYDGSQCDYNVYEIN